MLGSGFYTMRLSLIVLLAVAGGPAPLMLADCETQCAGACALAQPTVIQGDTPSPVVKVVADPPCVVNLTTRDSGLQLQVSLQGQPDADRPACALFEWLADGTELTATASFWKGDGPCCSDAFANGSLSPFVPVAAP